MAYTKQNWVDRVIQYPKRYKMKNISTGSEVATYDLEQVTGNVVQEGSVINATKLNAMDTGIFNNDAEITKIKDGTTKVPVDKHNHNVNSEDWLQSLYIDIINYSAPQYNYSTTDLTAGTSALSTGVLYFVYE